MIKFFKKTARKIFGHHKHHHAHAAPIGPVASTSVMTVEPSSAESASQQPEAAAKTAVLSQPIVAEILPAATLPLEEKSQPVAVEKVSRAHNKGLGRRTKNTVREARVIAPVSDLKIEEKAKDIALQL